MNFSVGNGIKSVNVNVSAVNKDGSSKTNAQMLREARDQINSGSANVKASVVEKDGMTTLELTGTYTGAANSFEVSGDLGVSLKDWTLFRKKYEFYLFRNSEWKNNHV